MAFRMCERGDFARNMVKENAFEAFKRHVLVFSRTWASPQEL
jgi:hypothetical protein